MFAFPLAVFVFHIMRGIIPPAVLWFSVVQAYYVVRLLDMHIVAKPTWRVTQSLSIAFLILSVAFSLSSLLTLPDPSTMRYINAALTFGFFFLFGLQALSVNHERATTLKKEHPMMFFETRTTGYYNIGASYFLAGFTAVGDLSQAGNLADVLFFGYSSIFLYVMAAIFFVYLLRSQRQTEQLKKTREGRKVLIKAAEDSWDVVVAKHSAAGRLMSKLLIPLSLGSMYAGVLGLWLAYSDFSFLLTGAFALGWAGIIFSYSQRRSGLSVKALLRVARGSVGQVRDTGELRRLTSALSGYSWTAAGLTVGLGQLIASENKLTIVDASHMGFTPLVAIYFQMFVLLLIGVLGQWIRWFGLPKDADIQHKEKISKMLNVAMTIFYVVTGGITGSAAYAFGVPVLVDAILGTSWVVTFLVLQYYLAYLKGGKGFEKYWRAAKRSAAIKM